MTLRRILILGASSAALLAGAPAAAETLQEALAKAYANNPTLTAERARQRATDENVPIARADGLPSAGTTAEYSENVLVGRNAFSPTRQFFAGINAEVPIYQGGAVANRVRAAERRVESGQAFLRATESSVFTEVVAAYMDVIRDDAILSLNRENVNVLRVNLQATRDRFEVGDLTRTDIAQSEARLALAEGDLRTAEANLIESRERYIRLVGDPPDNLEPPPPLPGLPESPDAAVDVAVENNPDLIAARQESEASRFDIRVAEASRRPRLSAIAQGGYNNFLNTLPGSETGEAANTSSNAVVGLQASIPLFQGGRPAAQVRQAQAFSSQAQEQVIETERRVIAQTRAAYASWQSSLQVIEASQAAVSANTLSLEGVRAENSVGNRTILDILDAQRELLQTQVNLVAARRNAYVAAFSVLAAMGRAEGRDLGLDGGLLYDPELNYRRVRNRIWDWDSDPTPVPQATRTVNTPAQGVDSPVQNPEIAPRTGE